MMSLFGKLKKQTLETDEAKNRKIAEEIIEAFLSEYQDREGFMKTLVEVDRDIIDWFISHEDEEKCLKVLEIAEDVNKEDKYGYTYLTSACQHHKVKTIEKLLEMGANPNHRTNPLLKALGRKNKSNPAILTLFLKYGVNLEADVNGYTLESMIRSFENNALNEILDCIH